MTAPALHETLTGVPVMRGMLLIEHPVPWNSVVERPRPALPESVRSLCASQGIRINLISPCHDRTGPPRWFLAIFGGRDTVLTELPRHRQQACLGSFLEQPTLGRPVTRPIHLVCTNGARNAECGTTGLAVARAAAAAAPGRTWESTHTGGCRFAPNLICLPSGVHYRGVGPDDASTVIRANDDGRIALPWYRGRAGVAPEAQAAEWAIRRMTGLTGLDAVTATKIRIDTNGEDRHITLHTDAGAHYARVRRRGRSLTSYDIQPR